jgi:hypothetical protein
MADIQPPNGEFVRPESRDELASVLTSFNAHQDPLLLFYLKVRPDCKAYFLIVETRSDHECNKMMNVPYSHWVTGAVRKRLTP